MTQPSRSQFDSFKVQTWTYLRLQTLIIGLFSVANPPREWLVTIAVLRTMHLPVLYTDHLRNFVSKCLS